MKKILTVDGFIYNNEERITECKNTFRWNSNLFDAIYIMCEDLNQFAFWTNVVDEYKLFNVYPEITNIQRPSCKQQMDFCNTKGDSNTLRFFANIDTLYTDSINKLKNYNFENTFFTFSNRAMRNYNGEYKPMEGDPLDVFNKTLSLDFTKFDYYSKEKPGPICVAHCGWAWIGIKETPEMGAYLGKPGGENRLLRQVRAGGYQVRSAAIICPTYHNHRSDIRTERYNERIDDAWGDGAISANEILFE